MAFKITEHESFLEACISGPSSKEEIIQVVGQFAKMDPNKLLPDLWVFADENRIPFSDYIQIAEAIKKHIPSSPAGQKSAFVASDALQKAKLELYVSEASILGLNIQLFDSRDQALAWITTP